MFLIYCEDTIQQLFHINGVIMNVSIMLNLKVMFIIGLLFIGLTAISAEENQTRQNEGKLIMSRVHNLFNLLRYITSSS